MSNIITAATEFAKYAHRNQKRKYTGEPYFVHCQEVADLVHYAFGTDEMVAAAFLHDTIEDCEVPSSLILELFGSTVCHFVLDLTDVSKFTDGNREKRKNIDLLHTSRAIPEAKTIKLADLISNTRSIVQYDPKFAHVYLREKHRLLQVLKEGDPKLFQMACDELIKATLLLKNEAK